MTYSGFKSRGNVTWHITSDMMAYYTFSQGFRPGGFNRSASAVAPGAGGVDQYNKPNGYAPDSLHNHEIGMKSTFLDHRLQLNLSAYTWSGTMCSSCSSIRPTGQHTFGVNGPNYHVKGVEAQIQALVTDGLTLPGSGSYNDDTQASSPCLMSNIAGSPSFGQCITQIIPKGGRPWRRSPTRSARRARRPPSRRSSRATSAARYDWTMDNYNAYVMVGVSYTGSMCNQPATYTSGAGVLVPNTTFLRYLQPAYTTSSLDRRDQGQLVRGALRPEPDRLPRQHLHLLGAVHQVGSAAAAHGSWAEDRL